MVSKIFSTNKFDTKYFDFTVYAFSDGVRLSSLSLSFSELVPSSVLPEPTRVANWGTGFSFISLLDFATRPCAIACPYDTCETDFFLLLLGDECS